MKNVPHGQHGHNTNTPEEKKQNTWTNKKQPTENNK